VLNAGTTILDSQFGMIEKEKFSTFFTGREFLASFLTMSYLEKFIPSPLDLIGIKKTLINFLVKYWQISL